MKLWTIQSTDFYETLIKNGIIHCEVSKSPFAADDVDNQKAYKWLSHKMQQKVGSNMKAEYPIWAWHTYDGMRKKPDLRRSAYAHPKSKCVCIEIDIPDEQVVLSDFDSWHNVLNNGYSSMTESEEEWERENLWLDSLNLKQRQHEVVKSWDNIFLVDYFENNWTCRGLSIQATFWEIRIEYVKKAICFTAR